MNPVIAAVHEPSPAPTAAIAVTLNGEPTELPGGLSVAELARRLDVRGRYAVEVNGEIVPRSRHAEHVFSAGDVIEIVHAIGGG